MKLGENLKRKRLEHKLTQEQFAEILNVSAQAISRWENGTTYPDIRLLPVIANYFDMTLDELIGMDDFKNEAKINEIFTEALTREAMGDIEGKIEILRNAVKIHPKNYGLIEELALALSKKDDIDSKKEAMELSEKVLASSTCEKLRSTTRANLYFLYRDTGAKERAAASGKTLPHIWESREILLPDLADADSREKNVKRSLNIAAQVLSDVINGKEIPFSLGYNESKEPLITEKAEKIYKILKE